MMLRANAARLSLDVLVTGILEIVATAHFPLTVYGRAHISYSKPILYMARASSLYFVITVYLRKTFRVDLETHALRDGLAE